MPEQTMTNPLGMKSINEIKDKTYGELLGDIIKRIFTWDWVFTKYYEKIIVIGSIAYTLISIWRWII